MRNIIEVIDQIQAVIPDGHGLKFALDKIVDSVRYTAPEAMINRWHDLADDLNDFADPEKVIEKEWLQKALSIFTTQPVEDIITYARNEIARRKEEG